MGPGGFLYNCLLNPSSREAALRGIRCGVARCPTRRVHTAGGSGPRVVLPHRYGNRGRSGTRSSVLAYLKGNPGPGSRGTLRSRTHHVSARSYGANIRLALRKGGFPYRTGGENSEDSRASPAKNTVLDGNFARDLGRPYRTRREVLPFLPGKNSVPVGKRHRTGGEVLPYFTGSITVPVEKYYRTPREVLRRFMLQIGRKSKRAGVAPVYVNALM